MDEISIGIIGAGMMGQEHIQNFNLLDGARVTALADTDDGMLNKAAAMTDGNPTLSDDFETLLGDDGPDALVIATPNFHHIHVLASALEAGKPILCEKPMCTTLADTQEVMKKVGHNGLIFQVGMEYRFKPALAEMIARVHGGTIGQIQMLSIREHRFPFLPKVGDWNRFNRNTGGTLVEKCCHFFDLMRFIIGSEPTGVIASGGQNVNHLDESYHGHTPDIWDNAYVVFDFANGARAMLDLCMFAEGSRHSEELAAIGDKAKVECLLPQNIVTHGNRETWEVVEEPIHVPEEILNAGYHSGATYHQNKAFLDAVRGTGDVPVTALDGHRAVAMGVAAQMAATEKRRVDMNEVGL
ncbi:MAG: Gfo/Idh/MocA family oxidoreductase [PS1 clade bacterium]|uniref:Gfo/Idh/MocA family oxidoreductase n=1 Tax=PS1 clade bacterium TaxID=2175152 RepID=A0A937L725_9PROT|nr:Gfo/Idh/MocA family oxidoreductase [PS1 clade bacterium]